MLKRNSKQRVQGLGAGWAAAGLVDTALHSFRLPFKLHRTEIAQRRVPPPGIIEAFDVIEHVRFGVVARAVRFRRGALGLERGEEALHRGLRQAGEQGRLKIRRGHEQQDPRHSAAELRLMRRGVPAPENPHLHAQPDMRSGQNHPLGREKTHNTERWRSHRCSN